MKSNYSTPAGEPCHSCKNYVHDLSIHPITNKLSCFLCISKIESMEG